MARIFISRFFLLLSMCVLPSHGWTLVAVNTQRVSESANGVEADDASRSPDISADGSRIVFISKATNLTNDNFPAGESHAFLRDRNTGDVSLVSRDNTGNPVTGGAMYTKISGDGRFVLYSVAQAPGDFFPAALFIRDLQTQTTATVVDFLQTSNKVSRGIGISYNGDFVAFDCDNQSLVPGLTPNQRHVFRWTRTTQQFELASKTYWGAPSEAFQPEAISDNGRYIAFLSSASFLVSDDNNGVVDVFVRDMLLHKTERANLTNNGSELPYHTGEFDLSGNGRYLTFTTHANGADPLYPELNSVADDVYMRDLQQHTTHRISVATNGSEASWGGSHRSSINGNGQVVVFDSQAKNFGGPDLDYLSDVFVRDLQKHQTDLVSRATHNHSGNKSSLYGVVSGDGSSVVYTSEATDLIDNDNNHVQDVFWAEFEPGTEVPLLKFKWPLEYNPWVNPYFTRLVEQVLMDHDQDARTAPVAFLTGEARPWRDGVIQVNECRYAMPANEDAFNAFLQGQRYLTINKLNAEGLQATCMDNSQWRALQQSF